MSSYAVLFKYIWLYRVQKGPAEDALLHHREVTEAVLNSFLLLLRPPHFALLATLLVSNAPFLDTRVYSVRDLIPMPRAMRFTFLFAPRSLPASNLTTL